MDEEAGFLRALIEQPDEPAHRLVYADWLDDHGEAYRAHLIRAQLALSRALRAPEGPFDPIGSLDVNDLEETLRERLLRPLEPLWENWPGVPRSILRPEVGVPHPTVAFSFAVRGGLVEQVHLRSGIALRRFTEHVGGLCERVPIRDVRIWPGPRWFSDGNGVLQEDGVTHEEIGNFLEQPAVADLRVIDVSNFDWRGNEVILPGFSVKRATVRLHVAGWGLPSEEITQRLQARFGARLVIEPPHDIEIPF